ncbi:MAG: hypothetical protein Ct9H300mP19_06450 [Dehalococcoidia bacterium]|nr:MAG: hypothetical protein Ct9H300mP19_06450 [Dehalococcoidia bacterium]
MTLRKKIQKVDSATIETPLKPMEHNRGPFAQGWWFVRRYPVIPIAVLIILVITAIIGPMLPLTSEMSASSVIDTFHIAEV